MPDMVPRSPHAEALARKIADRSAVVAVVGLGYVGLPLARAFFAAGFRVIGYDRDESKIRQLRAGQCYLKHLSGDLAPMLRDHDRFSATEDPDALAEADAVALCVPSPLGRHAEPDLTFIHDSTRMVMQRLRPGVLVSLESTTYPGTTRSECAPILEESGLRCGQDFFLAFSPEREDPGRRDHDTRTIPKLVGGVDPVSGELAGALYGAAVAKVVLCENAEIAEAAKILENVYRAVNIALVNELKPVLMSMGIDIWKVIAAAATKPFGFQPFYPGPGWGGHCIPIDPYYLTWKAKEFGHHTRFIELAGEINHAMPGFVVQKVAESLNHFGRAVRGASVLVLGIAYKPDVDDVRETPAAEIIARLRELGADVTYHDPHVAAFPLMRRYPSDFDLQSVVLTASLLEAADAVLVVTHHAAIDWDLVARHARLVVDTRNVMAGRKVRGVVVQA